ncbi:MAG: glycoside hydrolase family 95 protein [Acidobacteriaceae bacterium]
MRASRRAFLLGSMAAAALRYDRAAEPVPAQAPMWYDKPAERWLQALPVGNGRLGAMVFGGAAEERLHLTESTLWSGASSTVNVNPAAREHLPAIRELLFAGKYTEGEELCGKYLLGRPDQFGTALPLGFLKVETLLREPPVRYRRSLDLEEGVARVAFTSGGVRFRREVLASHPHSVIAVRLECDKPAGLSCAVTFSEPRLPGDIATEDRDLLLRGHAWEHLHSDGRHGVSFVGRVRAIADGGTVRAEDGRITVKAASSVTLLIAVASDFRDGNAERLCAETLTYAGSLPWSSLRAAHVRDHAALFRRVSLDLGQNPDVTPPPIDERRRRLAGGIDDPELCALFFQYGRYLTIAGSREDSPLPLALQGIWNDGLAAAMGWTDDFHLDINTEQNYWVCETGNLSECHAPVAKLVEELRVSGAQTAQQMYGAPGWVTHVVTNPWSYTAPGWGLGWGTFVTGGVWIALQLWDHFRFSCDRAYLKQKAWPALREAAVFFLQYMVEHPVKNWLVTGPSTSPENWFVAPDSGKPCSDSMGATCDRVLVYALLSACIAASEILGTDPELRSRMAAARDRLPPLQIGRHGQLQEWLEDFEEAEPNHRHTSHLIALYPENQISPEKTPALAAAARVTIERRIHQPNWEDTEWSRANLVNYYARLLDGDAAYDHLVGLIAHAADDSLLTYSRAGVAGADSNIFALDGNTGGAAGVAEMLLQSEGEMVHLLPALPTAWPAGSVRGLRARGGITVSIFWRNGALSSAALTADRTTDALVRYGPGRAKVHLPAGKRVPVVPAFFRKQEV